MRILLEETVTLFFHFMSVWLTIEYTGIESDIEKYFKEQFCNFTWNLSTSIDTIWSNYLVFALRGQFNRGSTRLHMPVAIKWCTKKGNHPVLVATGTSCTWQNLRHIEYFILIEIIFCFSGELVLFWIRSILQLLSYYVSNPIRNFTVEDKEIWFLSRESSVLVYLHKWAKQLYFISWNKLILFHPSCLLIWKW